MKSFGAYISKHLAYFAVFIVVLLLINVFAFGWTFYSAITKDYGEGSPQKMLEATAAASASESISDEMAQKLRSNHIWAMYLNQDGKCVWSCDLPREVPSHFTIQEAAVFSKGYLVDYPVFVRSTDNGLLVLGYPKDSFMKITGNYLPIRIVRLVPIFITGMLAADLLLLFLAYCFSKRKIIRNTEPIVASIEALSDGKPVSLHIHGELSEVADSVNKASQILSRQNIARANWISGVSHDIRTPLSMIMGYAEKIANHPDAGKAIREQAKIVSRQSVKIKELVQDLNLVSQLEYEMQPLNKKRIRVSKLLRSYAAELLNTGIPDGYSIELKIDPAAEAITMECDARLISRAINNLVQNSINHNPQGCEIQLFLECSDDAILITVKDNGTGLSSEKLQEWEKRPHYMESTDERLDLRHGLGLLLVKQIIEVHEGTMQIESESGKGYRARLMLPIDEPPNSIVSSHETK